MARQWWTDVKGNRRTTLMVPVHVTEEEYRELMAVARRERKETGEGCTVHDVLRGFVAEGWEDHNIRQSFGRDDDE